MPMKLTRVLKFLTRLFILKTILKPTILCTIDWDFEQLITCSFKLKWDWVIVLISNLPFFYLNFLWQRFRHIWNLTKFIFMQHYLCCIGYQQDLETQEEECKRAIISSHSLERVWNGLCSQMVGVTFRMESEGSNTLWEPIYTESHTKK